MTNVSKLHQATHSIRGIQLDRHADFSTMMASSAMPTPQEIATNNERCLDIRSRDCSDKDLSEYPVNDITFDTKTKFPTDVAKMPADFNPSEIMTTYKNPGLNVHELHKMGIDGTGVSIAIIDQQLPPHIEYNDNIVMYEKFQPHPLQFGGTMHGAAVASIAVGKTVAVAPGAKLYYFAAELTDGQFNDDETKRRTSKYYAAALDRIIQINESLADNEKISAVCISASPKWSRDPEIWAAALNRAKEHGIFVSTVNLRDEYNLADNGLRHDIPSNPDDATSYTKSKWWRRQESEDEQHAILSFPMDHRTIASPTGDTDYVHYSDGGWSWMKPYEVAMFALARQVDPTITPEQFFEIGLRTGTYIPAAQSVIVNPVKLISSVRERVITMQQTMAKQSENTI